MRLLWDEIPQAEDGARLPPATARTDPATSAEAEARHTASGARQAHCNRVLALVRNRPGSTSVELWQAQAWQPGCLDRHEVSRRLADLRHKGQVRQGDARECRVNGTRMVTWIEVGQENTPNQ